MPAKKCQKTRWNIRSKFYKRHVHVSLMSGKTCQTMVQCVKRLTLEDREKDRKREQEKDAADRLAEKEEAKNLKGLLRLDEILLMVQKSCQPVKIRCLSMFISLLYLHFYILPGAGCCCINYYMIEMNVYVVFLDVLDWHDIRMLPYYTFLTFSSILEAMFSIL